MGNLENMFVKYSNSGKSTDTGSPESQVAVFTDRIKHLTEYLKNNKKDHSSRLGLIKLVGKRKRFLSYLKSKNIERYRKIIGLLSLRK